MQLLGRKVEIEFGLEGSSGIRHTDLRIAFRVEKTRSSSPNKATITVYGLGDNSIDVLSRSGAVVRLLAGYGLAKQIFIGNPIKSGVKLERTGSDRVVTIEALDGGRAYREAQVSISYSGSVALATAYRAAIDAMGLPEGVVNLPSRSLGKGFAFTGPAQDLLNKLAAASGSQWFIRDGTVNFFERGSATSQLVPLISSVAGNLVGHPKQTANGIEITALLDAAFRPGDRVQLQSEKVNGTHTIQDLVFDGDSGYQSNFYAEMKVVPS